MNVLEIYIWLDPVCGSIFILNTLDPEIQNFTFETGIFEGNRNFVKILYLGWNFFIFQVDVLISS